MASRSWGVAARPGPAVLAAAKRVLAAARSVLAAARLVLAGASQARVESAAPGDAVFSLPALCSIASMATRHLAFPVAVDSARHHPMLGPVEWDWGARSVPAERALAA